MHRRLPRVANYDLQRRDPQRVCATGLVQSPYVLCECVERTSPVSLETASRAALLLFADRLETEAQALPRWEPGASEPWHAFVERQYAAELALAQQLQALPGCQLAMCSARLDVRLTFLRVRIRSKRGLAHACRLWAEKARAKLASTEAEPRPGQAAARPVHSPAAP